MTEPQARTASDFPEQDIPANTAGTSPGARLRHFARTHLRFNVIVLVFVTLTINQVQRAGQSIAGAPMSRQLHISSSELGWLFSAFAWSYMLFQLPGGMLLDRYGGKWVLGLATILASSCAGLIWLAPWLDGMAIPAMFLLIFLFGLASAPTYPACSKIVAAWFPKAERATATSVYNSSQFVAAGVFSPFMAWLATTYGWRAIWAFVGVVGLAIGFLFITRFNFPMREPKLTKEEFETLKQGDSQLDQGGSRSTPRSAGQAAPEDVESSTLTKLRRLLTSRAMLGLYIGQYCEGAMLYFFLTWFPIYLQQSRHVTLLHAGIMVAVPALFGLAGALLGGTFSDMLLRRTGDTSLARKMPIYVGMTLTLSMIACNYVSSLAMVVALMALANFGRALAALGWVVVADMSPKNALGLNGSIFNSFGNMAGIVMPIIVGYLVQTFHSFNAALIFVALHGAMAIFAYAFIVGPVRRLDPI